ncbi:hypothetical protein N9250_01055 [bacterium]|nr:hypothetical protein [bacterium]
MKSSQRAIFIQTPLGIGDETRVTQSLGLFPDKGFVRSSNGWFAGFMHVDFGDEFFQYSKWEKAFPIAQNGDFQKPNVCRVEIGSLDPAHEKQIATCWHIVHITTPCGMASASSATSLVATDTSRDD